MIDIRYIRENPKKIKDVLIQRLMELDVDRLLAVDLERRNLIGEAQELKEKRNQVSRQIGLLKKKGEDTSVIIKEMKTVSRKIQLFDGMIRDLDEELNDLLSRIPNIPQIDVPVGPDMRAGKIIREWGEKQEFDYKPRNHIELGETLGLMDFEQAAAVAGSHFSLFRGPGARLQRALINFMLDEHTAKNSYLEIAPPYLSNRSCMMGTGQLPLLEEDMYHLRRDDYFLVPTGEVPLTNLHRDSILDPAELPIHYVAYTPCFRREAGSYGRETRGLLRVHQFDKVELVRLVKSGESREAHEELLAEAENILQLLGLPYRVQLLPTGELSFASARCYDIEAWAPGQGEWLEVSSVSNFEDFQARRANIRYRDEDGDLNYPHTLNGSGVALPRTVVAILENYQQEDGTVDIPEVLHPYMGGLEKFEISEK